VADVAKPYPVTVGGNLPGKFQGWCQAQPVIGGKCTRCLLCWIHCPDGAVRQDGERLVVDYDYCKGCGICAHECPIHVITMVEVGQAR
jgi:2-oxoacid:acceptor oxidoreductase delta subunit (pyruvate/2-ketoisovalerate family)